MFFHVIRHLSIGVHIQCILSIQDCGCGVRIWIFLWNVDLRIPMNSQAHPRVAVVDHVTFSGPDWNLQFFPGTWCDVCRPCQSDDKSAMGCYPQLVIFGEFPLLFGGKYLPLGRVDDFNLYEAWDRLYRSAVESFQFRFISVESFSPRSTKQVCLSSGRMYGDFPKTVRTA